MDSGSGNRSVGFALSGVRMHTMKDGPDLPQIISRKEAKEKGLDRCFTGKPCLRGHIAERYTKSFVCTACQDMFNKRPKTGEFKVREVRSRTKENMRRSEEAFNAGETYYTPEKPCWNGHLKRYVSSNNCYYCHEESLKKRKPKAKYSRIKREYGLTENEYNELLEKQEWKCKICEKHESIKFKLHVDHCHDSGKVRGLLCNRCNQGIGLLKHSKTILENAIKYLDEKEEK